jgi:hypothetical protein
MSCVRRSPHHDVDDDRPICNGAARQAAGDLYQHRSVLSALFLLALIAFWPSYLSTPSTATGYTHFHAVTAATWMLMLVVQPLAVRNRQLGVHRALGRASYVIAPLVVIGMVLLAHSKTQGVPPIELPGFYVPLSLAGLSYTLAIAIDERRPCARFMVCTALTLIDPVVVRLLYWAYATPTALTDRQQLQQRFNTV